MARGLRVVEAPQPRVIGNAEVLGRRVVVLDRAPVGGARVLNTEGSAVIRVPEPGWPGWREVMVSVSIAEDPLVAVPTAGDPYTFAMRMADPPELDALPDCALFVVPEDLPHVLAAIRLTDRRG